MKDVHTMDLNEFSTKRKELWRELLQLEDSFVKEHAIYKVGDVLRVSFSCADRQITCHCAITNVGIGEKDSGFLRSNHFSGHIVYYAVYAYLEDGKWKKDYGTGAVCNLDNLNGFSGESKFLIVCGYAMDIEELKNISMEVVGKITL